MDELELVECQECHELVEVLHQPIGELIEICEGCLAGWDVLI